jgi:hypothetical protein
MPSAVAVGEESDLRSTGELVFRLVAFLSVLLTLMILPFAAMIVLIT